MSELTTEHVTVTVEGDNLTFEWRGPDAATRHDEWALTGAATYDRVVPAE